MTPCPPIRSYVRCWLLGCILVLCAGCAQPITTRDSAIKRMLTITQPDRPLLTYSTILAQPWQNKTVVLFTVTRGMQPDLPATDEVGYAIMSLSAQGWHVESGQSVDQQAPAAKVAYEVDHQADTTIVYGRTAVLGGTKAEVYYTDGPTEMTKVVGQHFVHVRAGTHDVLIVVLRNMDGYALTPLY